MHAGSSWPITVFILNLLDKFFFITPSCITHIPATTFVPDIFEISKHSIFLGILSKLKASFSSVNIVVLSFSLFSNVIFALFSAISTNLNFSPFCGAFISTFRPACSVNDFSIISLSSMFSFIIILCGKIGFPT